MSVTSTPSVTTSDIVQYLGKGSVVVTDAEGKIGFYGAAPVAKATVTGARDDGTALQSLLVALAAAGLIVDNSTAT